MGTVCAINSKAEQSRAANSGFPTEYGHSARYEGKTTKSPLPAGVVSADPDSPTPRGSPAEPSFAETPEASGDSGLQSTNNARNPRHCDALEGR